MKWVVWKRTVDGDGNSLGQVEAISTNEGRNLAKRVNVKRSLAAGGLNDFEVESIGLSSDDGGDGTAVALKEERRISYVIKAEIAGIANYNTYGRAVELSERHLETCSDFLMDVEIGGG